MAGPTLVKYPSYRQYETARITASDAMMALLAGSQLATHLLQLTDGSNRLLPEVFPKVPHIKRFNLTTDDANAILRSADEHLSAMGVPYALALHEDHMKSCIQLLEQVSLVGRGTADDSKLATQHDIIANATNGIFSSIARKQMNTLRHMRNCGIHSGGRASAALVTDVASWPPEVEAAWIKVAGRSLRGIARNDRVTFAYGEMILALAVAKTLDREANVMLQASLPRQSWSDMVVAELVSQQPAVIRSSVALRKANGIAPGEFRCRTMTLNGLRPAQTVSYCLRSTPPIRT